MYIIIYDGTSIASYQMTKYFILSQYNYGYKIINTKKKKGYKSIPATHPPFNQFILDRTPYMATQHTKSQHTYFDVKFSFRSQ